MDHSVRHRQSEGVAHGPRHQYVAELTDLFACTGRHHPDQLNEAGVLRWCAGIDRRSPTTRSTTAYPG